MRARMETEAGPELRPIRLLTRHQVALSTLVWACVALACDSGSSAGPDAGEGATVDASPDAIGCQGSDTPVDSPWHLTIDGRDRLAHVHLPAGYEATRRTPVVLNFHGYSHDGTGHALYSGMIQAADREGFIAVHPEGTGTVPSWNAGGCCEEAVVNQVDDVAFVGALLDALETRLCVDRRRIFVTGFSNGGMLSHRLACDVSTRIAAIAPVSGGSVALECMPARPVPVLHIHGDADAVVPYAGDPTRGFAPVVDTQAEWAARNGCGTTTHVVFQQGDATCITYEGCPVTGSVELCTIAAGGHTWPGAIPFPLLGKTSSDLSATDAMWAFFAAHPLPE